jgi:hypothetical protein
MPPPQQQANIVGVGNTVVQIEGDGNTIAVGHPHLALTRFESRRQLREGLGRLSPYTRSTSLLGRETELINLRTFLTDPRPLLARVLIGRAGSGKTRLALELCEEFALKGWATGFATRSELHRFFCQQNLSGWGWSKPTLLVVDYAAEQAKTLRDWFDELADRMAQAHPPLRILLLERNANTESGWWYTVFASGGYGAVSKRAMLDPAEPVTIRPLGKIEDRLELLRKTIQQSTTNEDINLPLENAAFREKLMRLSWGGDPLYLMMAALAMIELGCARVLMLGPEDLADQLAQREANRLQNLANSASCDGVLVQHLAACVSLSQGMNIQDFVGFATREKDAIGRPSGGDAAILAEMLHHALEVPNGIAAVQPDLIGEALIVRTLRGDSGTATVLRCFQTGGRPVIETVIRCAQDFVSSPMPLQWIDRIVELIWDDIDALAAFDDSLPKETVALREINLKVAERLHSLYAEDNKSTLFARVSALSSLALAQSAMGQRELALDSARRASDLCRKLANYHPEAYLPTLVLRTAVV